MDGLTTVFGEAEHANRFTDSQTGDTGLTFLTERLADIAGPIVLVWDSAPLPTRHKVRDFIAAQPRLHVFFLPKYAPELNPVECLWAQLSEHLACRAPQSIKELKRLVPMFWVSHQWGIAD